MSAMARLIVVVWVVVCGLLGCGPGDAPGDAAVPDAVADGLVVGDGEVPGDWWPSPTLPLGYPCLMDEECLSGYCGADWVCAVPPDGGSDGR